MINLPPGLSPASLLWCEDHTLEGQLRPEEGMEFDAPRVLAYMEQLVREVSDLQSGRADRVSAGLAHVRLGDHCRNLGKLGPALRHGQNARRIFRRHSYQPEQRHNEAVATYALGLVQQLLGDEQLALDRYEEALALLASAQKHWRQSGERQMYERCQMASEWIDQLVRYVSAVRSRGGTTALWQSAAICPWPHAAQEGGGAPAAFAIREHIPVGQVHIGDQAFDVHSTGDTVLTLKQGSEYYIVEPPQRNLPGLTVQPGDYVLVQKDVDASSAGGLIPDMDDRHFFVRFVRQDDGHIVFVAPGENKPARIIGGPHHELAGDIVAQLRPVHRDTPP